MIDGKSLKALFNAINEVQGSRYGPCGVCTNSTLMNCGACKDYDMFLGDQKKIRDILQRSGLQILPPEDTLDP